MDINDMVLISMYNYVSDNKIEFADIYDKLCSDIAVYIEEHIINEELTIDYDKISQLLIHFLSVEMNLEKFINYEQQIMNFIINDDVLDLEARNYNIAKSHKIIKLYQNIDQEQIIIDIMDKLNFKTKRKSH